MKLSKQANESIKDDVLWHATNSYSAPQVVSSLLTSILCDFHDEARKAGNDLELTLLCAARTVLDEMTVEEEKPAETAETTS